VSGSWYLVMLVTGGGRAGVGQDRVGAAWIGGTATLMFAGRDRKSAVRRQLPTLVASCQGWRGNEISGVVPATAVLRRVLALAGRSRRSTTHPRLAAYRSGLHLGPQEPGKLPSDRNHGHTLDVLAVLQLPEPAAQPQLRRPGASQGVGADLLLALAEGAGDQGR
jgi:hypothetical protein